MTHARAISLFSVAFPNATDFEKAELRFAVLQSDPKAAAVAIREAWQREKFPGDAVRRVIGLLKGDGSKCRAESPREENARNRAEVEAEREHFELILSQHSQEDIDAAVIAVTEAAEPELRFIFARGLKSPLVRGLAAKFLASRTETK